MALDVPVFILLEDPDLLPQYQTLGAAGADLRAFIENPLILLPRKSLLVPTGIRLEIPDGYELQIRSRSGLAARHQVVVLNSPGTIDSDYRGEIQVLLFNHGEIPFEITPRMRVAQAVLSPVAKVQWVNSQTSLSTSERGEGGFGHTGST